MLAIKPETKTSGFSQLVSLFIGYLEQDVASTTAEVQDNPQLPRVAQGYKMGSHYNWYNVTEKCKECKGTDIFTGQWFVVYRNWRGKLGFEPHDKLL